MLFITHDMSVIKIFSGSHPFMHEGSMVEYGNCEQIINDPQHEYTKQLL